MNYTEKTKNLLVNKFLKKRSRLTVNQIDYYLNEFDKNKQNPKIVQKDIMKYSFDELEKVIDSLPKKITKSDKGLTNIEPSDIIYDQNDLLILKGDTKVKCIKYGYGYSWCISRNDSSNMFNTYRYRYDEINFYFIFDKDLNNSNPNHALVLLIDKEGLYYLANSNNSGDFAGTKEFNWSEIVNIQPKLKDLKSLFKPLPLTVKEKGIYSKIENLFFGDNLLEHFKSYEIVEAYISFGYSLNDNQFINLDDKLKLKYINLGQPLSDNQLNTMNSKLIERYNNIHSLEVWLNQNYTLEEQRNLTQLDCSRNNLTNLKGIENLTNLTKLHCDNNKITSLKGIENLTNLEELYCYDNKLTNLKGIENLVNLISLDCYYNKLTSLKGIENLTKLNYLNCYANNLSYNNLSYKILNNNNIKVLQQEIKEKG